MTVSRGLGQGEVGNPINLGAIKRSKAWWGWRGLITGSKTCFVSVVVSGHSELYEYQNGSYSQ
jgi:tRNA G18 (ribose-2'-O)-methylase SpoU